MHRYFVLSSFIVLGIAFLGVLISHRMRGHEFMGKPPLRKSLFILGKICVFGSWLFFLLKAVFPSIGYIPVPEFLSWTATAVLIPAILIFVISFFQLGTALKMGLPNESTTLRTSGLYRFSRNPIYAAVFMMFFASLMYFPDPLNFCLAIIGTIIHYRTTLSEEKFLLQRFGSEWTMYTSRTRRYL
ncbi:MAG: isoprenylcysteine carboxylmethyltransferase family protein [Bacteroidota bacterium]